VNNSAMSSPFDWVGLLKWSMAYHDGTQDSMAEPMSQERMEFIINAMDNMVMDEVKRIRILLAVLELPNERDKLQEYMARTRHALRILEDRKNLHTLYEMREAEKQRKQEEEEEARAIVEGKMDIDLEGYKAHQLTEEELMELQKRVLEEKILALEEMIDRVGRIDNTVGLIKMDGLPTLRVHLRHENEEIRALTAQVIATVVQNSPIAQLGALRAHILQTLIALLHVHPAPRPDGTFPPLPEQFSLVWTDYKGQVVNFSPIVNARTKSGLAVVRCALYALTSLLANNTSGQLLFVQNNGLNRLVALLNETSMDVEVPYDHTTQVVGELKKTDLSKAWAPIFRRVSTLLLTLATSPQMVPEQTANDAVRSMDPNATYDPNYESKRDEERAQKVAKALEAIADKLAVTPSVGTAPVASPAVDVKDEPASVTGPVTVAQSAPAAQPAPAAAAPSFQTISTALVEVPDQPEEQKSKVAGPEHSAWKQLSLDAMIDVGPSEYTMRELVEKALMIATQQEILVTLATALNDHTGREELLTLLNYLCERSPAFVEWLNKGTVTEWQTQFAKTLCGHEDALFNDLQENSAEVPDLVQTVKTTTVAGVLSRHVLLVSALAKIDGERYETEKQQCTALVKALKRLNA